MLSRWAFASRSLSLVVTRYAVTAVAAIRKARNQSPICDVANECTLAITPLRVMNVPRIASRNVAATRVTFHLRSIPRFSWIITEWRNAVWVSHGNSDEFSTGSHAQYPPHPSSTYAHHMPSTMPTVRNSHDSSAHWRTAASHSLSSWRVISAAMTKAKGMCVATNPRYRFGG